MISNPNYNSSLVMRADVLWDSQNDDGDDGGVDAALHEEGEEDLTPRRIDVRGYRLTRTLVRRFVPRNPQLDGYLFQSCLFFREVIGGDEAELEDGISGGGHGGGSLVIYLPHASTPSSIPFYHPPVEGIAFLHRPSTTTPTTPKSFTASIHHLPFDIPSTSQPPQNSITGTPSNPNRLPRILHHLLSTLATHGAGVLQGYTKRVHHDQLIPRDKLQDTYLRLKATHAKRLIEGWVESTDPKKHVFEDLLIAAFLVEWWEKIYHSPGAGEAEKSGKRPWVGFVDIGCGNGVLVDILRREGWSGWGFDARKRKTWDVLADPPTSSTTVENPWLKEMLLIPSLLLPHPDAANPEDGVLHMEQQLGVQIHPGTFPPNTFLISNHSDQLTGWTPLLAAMSNCPFLAIPCCSYNLSGEKFRAPVPPSTTATATTTGAQKNTSTKSGGQGSSYAALCAWTEGLAGRVGWVVEREVLRIPSTRNIGILGREMVSVGGVCEDDNEVEGRVRRVLGEEGGGAGWVEKCVGLVKSGKMGGKGGGH